MSITVDDVQPDGHGRLRLVATIELDLTVQREADALLRVPRLMAGLADRLLGLWLVDDLADAIDYNRDDDR